MESVIVRATKTVEVGTARIVYEYGATIPTDVLNSSCLNPNILANLSNFMLNLTGEEEDV